MDEQLPWFRAMPADQRSWVTLVAQAGIASLVEWCRNPGRPPRLTGEVFGAAPRELVRAVAAQADRRPDQGDRRRRSRTTSRTVAEPGDEDALHLAVLQFSREVAFATAHVYASFAENRGAWDARLEALVVDALRARRAVRGAVRPGGRPRLGDRRRPVVVAGRRHAGRRRRPARRRPPRGPVDAQRGPRRGARRAAGRRPRRAATTSTGVADADQRRVRRGPGGDRPGRRRAGPGRRVGRRGAGRPACRPRLARRARGRWPPTRCWPSGPWTATRWPAPRCTTRVAGPLQAAGGEVLETVRAVLSSGGNLEASARAIFVHPNTVRYRLKRAAETHRAVGHRPARQLDAAGRARPGRAGPRPLALALSAAAP